jgi:hypothetical protein
MTRFLLTGLSLGLVLGLALPAAIDPASAVTRARIKVHPSRHWYGYGFLPGYHQPPALTDWRAQNEISAYRAQTDWRYYGWNGEPHYGFGHPGYYRGRYNGGSFGPCWTSTPIGMMPTCGQ